MVYSCIVPKSRKKGAIKFSRWVGEVIRTIRKTGKYENKSDRSIDPVLMLQAVQLSLAHFEDDVKMNIKMKSNNARLRLQFGVRFVPLGNQFA